MHSKKLDLGGCSRLQELLTSIGQLNAFQKLDLGGCSRLQELPTSLGQLNALQKPHLSNVIRIMCNVERNNM
jgi:hypothetical protein